MRKTGRSLKATVNDLLRVALTTAKRQRATERFVVHPHRMELQPGLDYDRISALIEELEGPSHR